MGDGQGFVPQLVSALRRNWPRLLSEYKAALNVEPSILRLAYPGLNFNSGNWTKLMLYDGEMGKYSGHHGFAGEPYPPRELHPRVCEHMSFTCQMVRPLIPGIVDPQLPYIQADQEQVNFFSLTP